MNPRIRNALYLLSLTPAVVVILGNIMGGWFATSNLIFVLVILAILELLIRPVKSNLHSADDSIPTFILLLHIPFQLIALSSLFYNIYTQNLTGIYIVFAAFSTGINSGIAGMVVSHELIHQKSKFKKFAGKLLLATTGNVYFYIDHIFVHHKYVATQHDNASARYGESLYKFFVRSVTGQFKAALQVEANRLTKKNKQPYGLKNYVVHQTILQITLLIFFYIALGWLGVIAWLVQCIFANFLLEYVNYIQHYGLNRELKQRVTEEHSWDSDQFVSRFFLVDLARHADHHYYASKPYHKLINYPSGPKLPAGYASLFFVAAIPKWWYAVMHKRIKHYS